MTTLSFTLSPDAVAKIHDTIVCLSKFSELVGLDATSDKVRPYPPWRRSSKADTAP